MNNRERMMAVFNRQKADKLVWQPRLHYWYEVNKARGTLPKIYERKDILEIYDDLCASPRAYHYFNDTIECVEGEGVQLEISQDEDHVFTKYKTPKGNLTQTERKTLFGTNRMRVEYFLKNVDDFEILKFILKHQSYEFDKNLYTERDTIIGNRSEPMFTIQWGSIQKLTILYMGLERSILAVWKYQDKVKELLEVFDENDDGRFNLLNSTPFKIFMFGDNIDENLCPPKLFKDYMLPYYQKRTTELHEHGKFCTSHWDGKIKHVLPFAKETGLDGLECVPPLPQGNVTLEELKEGLGNMILFDGIPATHFLSFVNEDELEVFVRRMIALFSPNIVLGISDMLPPEGDIEKVRKIGEVIAKLKV